MLKHRRLLFLIHLAILAIACARELEAQYPDRPAVDLSSIFAQRTIKVFDFDERPLGNLEDIPMHWEKVTLSGFPHYVNGAFDDKVGLPGPSFKLQLNGGNIGYVFSERHIPAFPGSDHKIIAYVKSENLRHARGYIQTFYMDRLGNPLPQTIAYSSLITPPDPRDPEWRTIEIDLPYTHAEGRFIGIGIFLVQQDRLPPALSPPIKSYRKDIDAALWIDQITVLRLPKARLRLDQNTSVYQTTQNIIVEATVADAATEDLSARILLHDLTSDQVTSKSLEVAVLPPLEAILRGQASQPQLIGYNFGRLQPGLFRIALQVLSRQQVIIERTADIAVLPPVDRSTRVPDFGLDLTETPIDQTDLITAFIDHLRPGWVAVPVWRQDIPLGISTAVHAPADQLIMNIHDRKIGLVGAFLDVPEEMAERTEILNPSLWDLFTGEPDGWRSELSIFLSRNADKIEQWIFGPLPDCWDTPDQRIEPVLNRLQKEFQQFQGQFSFIASWPAMATEPVEPISDGFFTKVPSELLTTGFTDYFDSEILPIRRLWAVFPGQDLRKYDLESSVVDFVSRFIHAKRNHVRRLAARDLWTESASNSVAPGRLEPNAYYVAYANLIRRLGGLSFLGEIKIAPEHHGLLFGSSTRAVLVLMDPNPASYQGVISLGDRLSAFDLWGRTLDVKKQEDRWIIPYRPIIFLDGIDGELARFIASIRFDPDQIPGKFGTHQINLIFTNTFSQSISGMMRIQGPPFWQFDPSGAKFATPPGNDFTLPIKLRHPSNEPLGRKPINLRFDLEARKPIDLNLILPLHLDSSELEMNVMWFRRDRELVVSQEIMNTGDHWVDLTAFLIAPDRPRMERQVRRLGPGQTSVKEYSLGPWASAIGQIIRIGFREIRGNRLVNKVIALE